MKKEMEVLATSVLRWEKTVYTEKRNGFALDLERDKNHPMWKWKAHFIEERKKKSQTEEIKKYIN